MSAVDLKNKVLAIEKRRYEKKQANKDLRRKYFVPMTLMLFFSFYAIVSNVVLILWLMAKNIMRKNGMNHRKKSLLDRVDVISILATSIFPQSTPSSEARRTIREMQATL